MVLGFELTALHLPGKCFTTCPVPPALFALGCFSNTVLLFLGQLGTKILLPVPPTSLGLQTCTTIAGLFVEMEVLLTFAKAGLEPDSLKLYLPGSWSYRFEPPCFVLDFPVLKPS
jgi:hypothetical protein